MFSFGVMMYEVSRPVLGTGCLSHSFFTAGTPQHGSFIHNITLWPAQVGQEQLHIHPMANTHSGNPHSSAAGSLYDKSWGAG